MGLMKFLFLLVFLHRTTHSHSANLTTTSAEGRVQRFCSAWRPEPCGHRPKREQSGCWVVDCYQWHCQLESLPQQLTGQFWSSLRDLPTWSLSTGSTPRSSMYHIFKFGPLTLAGLSETQSFLYLGSLFSHRFRWKIGFFLSAVIQWISPVWRNSLRNCFCWIVKYSPSFYEIIEEYFSRNRSLQYQTAISTLANHFSYPKKGCLMSLPLNERWNLSEQRQCENLRGFDLLLKTDFAYFQLLSGFLCRESLMGLIHWSRWFGPQFCIRKTGCPLICLWTCGASTQIG